MIIWKDIQGYEGLYQVSNTGDIRGLDRKRFNGYSYYDYKGKKLKGRKTRKGYLTVVLYIQNNTRTFPIHRLVAQAFIPNPNNLPQVNHKDGNKQNNCVDNLEWITNKDNQLHAWKLGLQKTRLGKDNPASKVVVQIDDIGNTINVFESISSANKFFNRKYSHINECCYGRRKKCFGYKWRFLEGEK